MPAGPYGLPAGLFERLWTVDDVCSFCRVERTKARQLLALPDAPPRMRMGSARCDRWNPVQVVAWLHGDDWRTVPGTALGTVTHDGTPRFPGSSWQRAAPAGRAS